MFDVWALGNTDNYFLTFHRPNHSLRKSPADQLLMRIGVSCSPTAEPAVLRRPDGPKEEAPEEARSQRMPTSSRGAALELTSDLSVKVDFFFLNQLPQKHIPCTYSPRRKNTYALMCSCTETRLIQPLVSKVRTLPSTKPSTCTQTSSLPSPL